MYFYETGVFIKPSCKLKKKIYIKYQSALMSFNLSSFFLQLAFMSNLLLTVYLKIYVEEIFLLFLRCKRQSPTEAKWQNFIWSLN